MNHLQYLILTASGIGVLFLSLGLLVGGLIDPLIWLGLFFGSLVFTIVCGSLWDRFAIKEEQQHNEIGET